MARTERTFLTELKRSTAPLQPIFFWKIPDAGFTNYFDVVCCYQGKFMAIEAKMSKLKTKVNFKQLFSRREHELLALKKVEAAGGIGLILVNVFIPHKENFCYAVRYKDYEFIKWNQSVHLSTLDQFLPRHYKKNGVWPLREILTFE